LQTFCQSEGLRVPDEVGQIGCSQRVERLGRSEHAECSIDGQQELEVLAGQHLARIMGEQSNYFDLFLKEEFTHLVERMIKRAVDQAVELLDAQHTGDHERSMERSTPAITDHKTTVLTRLRALQAEGLSLQAIADKLNAKSMPTLSGKGR
jgi:hypothetical protein